MQLLGIEERQIGNPTTRIPRNGLEYQTHLPRDPHDGVAVEQVGVVLEAAVELCAPIQQGKSDIEDGRATLYGELRRLSRRRRQLACAAGGHSRKQLKRDLKEGI